MPYSILAAAIALALQFLLASPLSSLSLSLEEKIGQMMMVHFNGDTVNDIAETLITEEHVGGIILFNWSNGLTSPEQVRALTTGLQHVAGSTAHATPLLIAIDQEGGVVTRLTKGFTFFPGNRALARTMDSHSAYRHAFAMALEQLDVGINMTLAPVIDVVSTGPGSVIGVRSYGSDPALVTMFGAEALAGYKEAGIIATLKHFPGLGGVAIDPHHDMPVNDAAWETLQSKDLAPFVSLAKNADVVMTGHVIAKALDPDACATLSKPSLNYLREVCGFDGMILSDSLVMDAILRTCHTVEEAAVKAILAGCDMLLLGGKELLQRGQSHELGLEEIRSIKAAICTAVRDGTIDEEQIDRSVARVIALKNRLASNVAKGYSLCDEHQTMAEDIAMRSLKMTVRQPGLANLLNDGNVMFVAPLIKRQSVDEALQDIFGKRATTYYYSSCQFPETGVDHVSNVDGIIFFSHNAWKSPFETDLLRIMAALDKPLIHISLADEEDLHLVDGTAADVAVYNPSPASIKHALNRLITMDETSP